MPPSPVNKTATSQREQKMATGLRFIKRKRILAPYEIRLKNSSTCEAFRQRKGVTRRIGRRVETEEDLGEWRSARLERIGRRFARSFITIVQDVSNQFFVPRQAN